MKRIKIRARGRADRMRKPLCNIEIKLTEKIMKECVIQTDGDEIIPDITFWKPEDLTSGALDTNVVVDVNKKKEIIKLILILVFLYDPLSSILLKFTKLNKTMFWICKAVLLLISLYFVEKKF